MNVEKIEYRVRPVTRYIVTRYEQAINATALSSQHGEFDNGKTAHAVAYALCKAEHERLGLPLNDSRIVYPNEPPQTGIAIGLLRGENSDD